MKNTPKEIPLQEKPSLTRQSIILRKVDKSKLKLILNSTG